MLLPTAPLMVADPDKPLVVHHYYPLGSGNVGDEMVALALRKHLVHHFGPCRFVDMPVNDRCTEPGRPIGLRGENLQRSNAEADLVVIGGSNLLEPRKPRYDPHTRRKVGRIGIDTDIGSLRQLKVPLLLVGMGSGSSFGQPMRDYEPDTIELLHELFGKAFAHDVRDATTASVLLCRGVKTTFTGCPVMFLTETRVAPQKDGPVAVSFPPFYIGRAVAGKLWLWQTFRFIRDLYHRGVPMAVTLHEDRDVDYVRRRLPTSIPVFWTDNPQEQIAFFTGVRGVVGFRLHAALLGLGLGKPVVPIGVDWRGRGMIRTFDAGQYAVMGDSPLLDGLSLRRRLLDLTDLLVRGDPELAEFWAQAKVKALRAYHTFLTDAAGRFCRLRQQRAAAARR